MSFQSHMCTRRAGSGRRCDARMHVMRVRVSVGVGRATRRVRRVGPSLYIHGGVVSILTARYVVTLKG